MLLALGSYSEWCGVMRLEAWMSNCLLDISTWMSHKHLRPNLTWPYESDGLLLRTHLSLHYIILPVAHTKNLGIVLGLSLSFPTQSISRFYWLSSPKYIPNLSTWLRNARSSWCLLRTSYSSDRGNDCCRLAVRVPKVHMLKPIPVLMAFGISSHLRDLGEPPRLFPTGRHSERKADCEAGPRQTLDLSAPWSRIFSRQNCGKWISVA